MKLKFINDSMKQNSSKNPTMCDAILNNFKTLQKKSDLQFNNQHIN